ncbi:permease [candidate division KSB1 bacterium 4484_188]|nr:MAG: permease [candidate division KSB1 bacterium 4484_188]HFE63832.1 permease [Caldithrix sp.]
MNTTAIVINLFAFTGLVISLGKDRGKTVAALKVAWQVFLRILPLILLIVVLIGIMMGFIPRKLISQLLGEQSKFGGIMLAALFGSVLHIPSLIAFPLAVSFLNNGAAITAVATFITTLTMIGVVTFPLEMKELGRDFALLRNGLSFVVAVLIGLLMGLVL